MRARPNKSPIPDGEAVTFTGQFSAVPSRETFAGRGQKGTRYVEGSTNKPRLVFIACDLPAALPKQEDVLTRVSDGTQWAIHEVRPDHNGRVTLELHGPKGIA